MYTNVDDVLAWLVLNRVQNFLVFQAGREDTKMGNSCILNCTFDDDTLDNKRQSFIDTIKSYGDGDYVIRQMDGNSKNAVCKLRISGSGKGGAQVQQQAQINGIPNDCVSRKELEAILAEQQAKFNAERLNDKMARLEKELEEAKKEAKANGGAMSEFFQKVTPFVAPVLQGFLSKKMPQSASMIGALDRELQNDNQDTSNETELDMTEEELAQVYEALQAWKEKDPDYIKILCALPKFVENPMYNTAKNFILQ